MIHSTLLVFLVQGVIQPSDARRSLQVETSEVEEADDVNEAAEVLRPGKSPLMSSKSSRALNSALF